MLVELIFGFPTKGVTSKHTCSYNPRMHVTIIAHCLLKNHHFTSPGFATFPMCFSLYNKDHLHFISSFIQLKARRITLVFSLVTYKSSKKNYKIIITITRWVQELEHGVWQQVLELWRPWKTKAYAGGIMPYDQLNTISKTMLAHSLRLTSFLLLLWYPQH